jgi:hypothetical protein
MHRRQISPEQQDICSGSGAEGKSAVGKAVGMLCRKNQHSFSRFLLQRKAFKVYGETCF